MKCKCSYVFGQVTGEIDFEGKVNLYDACDLISDDLEELVAKTHEIEVSELKTVIDLVTPERKLFFDGTDVAMFEIWYKKRMMLFGKVKEVK